MNKLFKLSLVAVALTAVAPVFAAEAEVEEEEGAIGWTPIAIGVASPVQLPWGRARWDVFGLDLNALYSEAPLMYGLGIGGAAMVCRDNMKGIQLSGLCNWNTKDVYGVRMTAGANVNFGTAYGIDLGLFGYRGDMWGFDTEFIGSYQKNFWGLEIGGIVNLATEQSYGATIAVGGNMAKKAYGLQMGVVFNFTDELHGCQVGLVNFAQECPWGFQIGLINVIMDNSLKVLPFVNGYF